MTDRRSETPGTEKFLAAYRTALGGVATQPQTRTAPTHGSLRWLCIQYYRSADYRVVASGGTDRGQKIVKYQRSKKVVVPRGGTAHRRPESPNAWSPGRAQAARI